MALCIEKLKALSKEAFAFPEVTPDIPHGDMPGDKIGIDEGHIAKAQTIFPLLINEMIKKVENDGNKKIVLCVCGGSGVGKSEIASILSWYLKAAGIEAYTLSGDNYPRRIPMYNDAERLHIFREAGLKGMIADGVYTAERFEIVKGYQEAFDDANAKYVEENPWFASYLKAGRTGLAGYLGTANEINFAELSEIIKAFHEEKESIYLKRMGRTDTELWYDAVDMSQKDVLIVEWTHGNNDLLQGVDIPILLNSTPAETLAHRRARNRDGATDSAFTTMVLEIEQELLKSQAHKAKIIIAKSGDLLLWEDYQKLMEA